MRMMGKGAHGEDEKGGPTKEVSLKYSRFKWPGVKTLMYFTTQDKTYLLLLKVQSPHSLRKSFK